MTTKKSMMEVLEFEIKQLTGERGTVSYAVVHDDNGEVSFVRWMDPRTDTIAVIHDFAAGHSPTAAGFYATGEEAKSLYNFLNSAYRKVTVVASARSGGRVRFYNQRMMEPARNLFRKY